MSTLAAEMAALSDEQLEALIADVGEPVLHAAMSDPAFSLRPKQEMMWDLDWRFRVMKGGRGLGKNHAAKAAIKQAVFEKGYRNIAIVARVSADLKTTIAEHPSTGLLSLPRQYRPRITYGRAMTGEFPNGARIVFYSADKPDAIRSLSADFVWCDEMAAYKTSRPPPGEPPVSVWDNIRLATREGDARILVTTTPRNRPELRALLAREDALVTTETTFANAANLGEKALDDYRHDYMYRDEHGDWQFTRIGLQEVKGELISDLEGAMWKMEHIEAAQLYGVDKEKLAAAAERIVVAIDPAQKAKERNDYTAMVCAARMPNGMVFILESAAYRGTPAFWAGRVAEMYKRWSANEVILEDNSVGDVGVTILEYADPSMRVSTVRAVKDKAARADPVHNHYELGKVKHCSSAPGRSDHAMLEDQMAVFPLEGADTHDDLVDALVWAVHDLAVHNSALSWTLV